MIPAHLPGEQPFRRIALFLFALFRVFSWQIQSAGSGVQAADHLIELVGNPRVHISLNYQPSAALAVCFASHQFYARPAAQAAKRHRLLRRSPQCKAPADYIINGHMIGGSALVTWPAEWGNSGVMTFIVNQQGKIYEKNLGPNTAALAKAMTRYDPDGSWSLVNGR